MKWKRQSNEATPDGTQPETAGRPHRCRTVPTRRHLLMRVWSARCTDGYMLELG